MSVNQYHDVGRPGNSQYYHKLIRSKHTPGDCCASQVCCVAWWGSGKHLATGSHDCSVKVWDLERQWSSTPQLMRATSKCNALHAGDGDGNATLVSGDCDFRDVRMPVCW